jgi:hypothetical protein
MTDNFHYSWLLPQKPGVILHWEPRENECSRCGQRYSQTAANAKRCPKCAAAAEARTRERANAKLAAKRAAERSARRKVA